MFDVVIRRGKTKVIKTFDIDKVSANTVEYERILFIKSIAIRKF